MTGQAKPQAAVRHLSDPVLVMRRLVEQAVRLIPGADGAAVELLVDGRLRHVCTTGSLGPFVGTRLDPATSLSGLAPEERHTERCDDTEMDPRVDREACRRVGSASMICVALRRGVDPVGVLKGSSRSPGAFGDVDVATLSRLGRLVTTVISAARDLSDAADDLLRGSPGEDRGA